MTYIELRTSEIAEIRLAYKAAKESLEYLDKVECGSFNLLHGRAKLRTVTKRLERVNEAIKDEVLKWSVEQ